MTIPTILAIIALALALVVEFRAQGRDILGWAVVFICIGLLWGNVG